MHIYSSRIKTLEGIENLNHLEELSLAYNRELDNIVNIRELKSLKKLSIEKCKNINEEGIKLLKEHYQQFRPYIYCNKD